MAMSTYLGNDIWLIERGDGSIEFALADLERGGVSNRIRLEGETLDAVVEYIIARIAAAKKQQHGMKRPSMSYFNGTGVTWVRGNGQMEALAEAMEPPNWTRAQAEWCEYFWWCAQ